LNVGIRGLWPTFSVGPFNIFSMPGIVWVHLMSTVISVKVMLLTPAFRNMDASFEEASRASSTSTSSWTRRTAPGFPSHCCAGRPYRGT